MNPRSTRRRARVAIPTLAIGVAASLIGSAGSPATAAPATPELRVPTPVKTTASYIVQLAEPAVAGYQGGIAGLAATKAAEGQKLDPAAPAPQAYRAHLQRRQQDILASVGASGRAFYGYQFTINAVAASLDSSQVAALKRTPGVAAVTPDTLQKVQTDNTPEFLRLSQRGALWDQLGGEDKAGEDVIVGVIDTGIVPEHPSFVDREDASGTPSRTGTRVYTAPPKRWKGTCQAGERFAATDCNHKLIGARWFVEGFGRQEVVSEDFLSPRDADGHGSHTAGTAAGNYGVPASILGNDFGDISGVAPRARVAAYKVCWNGDAGGCATTDLVAAIEAAYTDGVDVINYSIGSSSPALDPTDIQFLIASDEGVFVSQSSGNDGPAPETIGTSSAPWITSVAAGTQNRTFQGSAVLGNGRTFRGETVTKGIDSRRLVDAADAGDELCQVGKLDPAKVRGTIVLCKRGTNPRVEKSYVVQQAGGVGMILYNADDAQDTVTDNHYIASVHVDYTPGLAIKRYIRQAGARATARITGGERAPAQGSTVAAFSSRGPNRLTTDILKPDIIAPGVNVLAAESPDTLPGSGASGQFFQSISGTSMSAPHVAGVGALLTQAHRGWSAARIKSAMMTTARQDVKTEDGTTQASPFDMGSGYVVPPRSRTPGLVYDASTTDYVRFACGLASPVFTAEFCSRAGGAIDPSDLNQPNIAIGELNGRQTVRREVTNVGEIGTYRVRVQAPAGVGVQVSPPTLTLGYKQKATYTVTFTTRPGATYDEYSFGSLTWVGAQEVRSTLVVRPVRLSAPTEVVGTGRSGSVTVPVGFGYAGEYQAVGHGPVAAVTDTRTVQQGPTDINEALASGKGVQLHEVTTPAGVGHARFALYDEDTDGNDDLDLYVFDGEGNFVGGSGGGTSTETVDLPTPAAGTYTVVVHAFDTDGPDARYTLSRFAVPKAGTTFAVGSPDRAVLGGSADIVVRWSGLTAGSRYLGAVTHHAETTPRGFDDQRLATTLVPITTG